MQALQTSCTSTQTSIETNGARVPVSTLTTTTSIIQTDNIQRFAQFIFNTINSDYIIDSLGKEDFYLYIHSNRSTKSFGTERIIEILVGRLFPEVKGGIAIDNFCKELTDILQMKLMKLDLNIKLKNDPLQFSIRESGQESLVGLVFGLSLPEVGPSFGPSYR